MNDTVDFSEPNDDTHVIDMDAVGEATFELLPKGWHEFVVTAHDFEYSQNSGKPMWVLELEVSDQANDSGEVSQFAGKKRKYYISFSEKALAMSKKTINTVWPGLLEDENWKTNGRFDVKKVGDASLFVGDRVRGLIKHTRYEGQQRDNVASIVRSTSGGNAFMAA
jgi:hypothetical protein